MSRPRLEGRGQPTSRPRPATPPFDPADVPSMYLPHPSSAADRSVTFTPSHPSPGMAAWPALASRRTVSHTMKLAFQTEEKKGEGEKEKEVHEEKEEAVRRAMLADGDEWVDYVRGHLRELYPSFMGDKSENSAKDAAKRGDGSDGGKGSGAETESDQAKGDTGDTDNNGDKGKDTINDRPDLSNHDLHALRGIVNGFSDGMHPYYAMFGYQNPGDTMGMGMPGMGTVPPGVPAMPGMSGMNGMPMDMGVGMGMGMGMQQMPPGSSMHPMQPMPATSTAAPGSASAPASASASAPPAPPTASSGQAPTTEQDYEAYMAQYAAFMQQQMQAQQQSQYAFGYPYAFDGGPATTGDSGAKDVPATPMGMGMGPGMGMGVGGMGPPMGMPMPMGMSPGLSSMPAGNMAGSTVMGSGATPLPGQRSATMPTMSRRHPQAQPPPVASTATYPHPYEYMGMGMPLPGAPNAGGMPDLSSYAHMHQQTALGINPTTLTRALDVVRALDAATYGPRPDSEIFAEANLVALGMKPRLVESGSKGMAVC